MKNEHNESKVLTYKTTSIPKFAVISKYSCSSMEERHPPKMGQCGFKSRQEYHLTVSIFCHNMIEIGERYVVA